MLGQELRSNVASHHRVSTKQPCDFPRKQQQTVWLLGPTAWLLLTNEHPVRPHLPPSPTHAQNFAGRLKSVHITGHNQSVVNMRVSSVHGDPAEEKVRGSGSCWCHGNIRFYLGGERHKTAHLQDGCSYSRREAKDAFK